MGTMAERIQAYKAGQARKERLGILEEDLARKNRLESLKQGLQECKRLFRALNPKSILNEVNRDLLQGKGRFFAKEGIQKNTYYESRRHEDENIGNEVEQPFVSISLVRDINSRSLREAWGLEKHQRAWLYVGIVCFQGDGKSGFDVKISGIRDVVGDDTPVGERVYLSGSPSYQVDTEHDMAAVREQIRDQIVYDWVKLG